MNKKIILVSLLSAGILFGCVDPVVSGSQPGSQPGSEPGSEEQYKPDLSSHQTLKLSVNYDKNTGMKYNKDEVYTTPKGTQVRSGDFKPVWKELQTRLNFTVDDVTIVGDKAVNQFKNNWDTDRYADLACGNVSDIVKSSVAGTSESLLDLSEYM